MDALPKRADDLAGGRLADTTIDKLNLKGSKPKTVFFWIMMKHCMSKKFETDFSMS